MIKERIFILFVASALVAATKPTAAQEKPDPIVGVVVFDDFAVAFASEPACKGLSLAVPHGKDRAHSPDKGQYWLLTAEHDPLNMADKTTYWNLWHSADGSEVKGADHTSAEAAQHVCAIVKQEGGTVK